MSSTPAIPSQWTLTWETGRVGDAPYNILTKFGALNLTFPDTKNYVCDIARGYCASASKASFVATVTGAVS